MRSLPVLIISFALCTGVFAQETISRNSVTPSDLSGWINYLASDQMKGRLNGSPEMDEAAGWISARFKEYGVQSFTEWPDYFQPYEAESRGNIVNEKNVIGYIPGIDPALKDEYIILTAHFDHIGIRASVEGDSIYNGADDNAAGTCTLIGIAKALKMNGIKPGRGIIFAAVSGEEIGLRGSRYLVKNLPVPVESLYANLNFEMIGHSEYLGPGKYYMTGTELSNLDDLINDYSQDRNISLIDTIQMASRLFYMSDNAAFARISVSDG
ncbi:MAG: M28 family peptidase, partial [Bacteroidia bacterium]